MYLGKVVEFATVGGSLPAAAAPVHAGAPLGQSRADPGRKSKRIVLDGRRAEPDQPSVRLPLPHALPARPADLQRGGAAARGSRRRSTRAACHFAGELVPETAAAARMTVGFTADPRHPAAPRPPRADARRHLAVRRRLPPARRAGACRRSCSGRRTSRRASASSRGASGSRSAATRRSSSTCRGRYESEGDFTAWTYDGQDAYDTVTWAAGEQWSNGRIGTWGRSYGGLVQWQLAHLQHPNVQCLAPQVIHDDYFWDGYWTGGAFQLALTLGAAALWSSAMSLITGPSARDIVLNDRIFGHLPLIELDEVTIGRKVDYWRLWWEHQVNDEYWQAFRHRPEQVDVPIFQQGGWFDPYSGSHLRSFAGDRRPACRTAS